jgi:hypothetical protein
MSFKIENYFAGQGKEDVVFYYKGNIDSDVINQVLDTVEGKMVDCNEQSRLRKKVYNVLVESLQNLYHHADKMPDDFGENPAERFAVVMVKKEGDGYKITTGNFVRTENIEKLEEKIKRIKRSTNEEIKELYKFILNHQRISSKGGGGLGLVDIARKTGNNLDYTIVEYNNNYCFFYLDIRVTEES